MSLSARIARNTAVQILSKVLSTALGLAAVAIITRYLGQNGFGQYTTVMTFSSFFAILADFGLTLVTAQMISRPGADRDKILSNLFALRLVSALVFSALGVLIVLFLPYPAAIKLGVAIIALSFIFTALNQVLIGLFQNNLRMDRVAIAENAGRAALLLGAALAAGLDWGLEGIFWVSVFSSLVNFVIIYLFSLKHQRIQLHFDKAVWAEIAKKSWPLALTIAFNLVYLKTDTLILSLVKSQADVGLYGAAYKVVDVLVSIPFMFAGLVLPVLSAAWAEDNEARLKSALQRSFDAMVILALPLFFGTQFTATSVMTLVAGKEFAVSGAILRILIAASSIIFLGSIFSHAIIAIDKQKKIIWAYVFTSVTAVAGYIVFIPKYSYFGAAWVTVYSESAIALAAFYVVHKYLRFIPKAGIFFKALAASLVMSLALYLLPGLNLGLKLILAAGVYLAALAAFRGLAFLSLGEIMVKK